MAHGLLPAEAGPGSVAQEAEAATAEAIPGAPIQAGPPYLYAYYYMSALAEMDPENTITHLITLIDSQDYQDIENFGDESSIAELQSLLTQKHQLLHGAFDSQKRTMAQLENAISCMLAEQAWMASMQAQLQAFSVKVDSALAQMLINCSHQFWIHLAAWQSLDPANRTPTSSHLISHGDGGACC